MKSIDYSYFIERYLSGEMTRQEKTWFEKELNGNEFLQKEVAVRRKTDDALRRHDIIELRNKLARIEIARQENEAVKLSHKKTAFRSAAIIAGLIVVGSLFLLNNKNSSRDSLYNDYFTVYNIGSLERSIVAMTDNIGKLYKDALVLYNENNFEGASAILSEYLKNRPDHMEAYMVYGVSEMKNNRFDEAEKAFSTVINDGNNYYLDNARWYRALCYIKTGQTDAAKNELLSIKNSENSFSKKASAILKKLK
ncbi:MAG TPA: tetratricopeptide repeat protein [Bacteroidales bacterium]|nr:tetratricopeptide repeat protein [Bacteroidales bacterium]HOU95094.1 tetratricopeptide repeat protein [Bacteroidales bacterium]HQG36416.1 tetratricopeptide repeat protein [Bacteroidales bacterium]HQG53410.1 tetratricopeptide repeat protein [Bacteroidales bacterium]HQJ20514.1 tetratricopeptide repeat protein [Bacteroidales bacterium]